MAQSSERPGPGARRVVHINASRLWAVPTDELLEGVAHIEPGSKGAIAVSQLFRLVADNAMGFLNGAKPSRWPPEMSAGDALRRVALLLDLADSLDGLGPERRGN